MPQFEYFFDISASHHKVIGSIYDFYCCQGHEQWLILLWVFFDFAHIYYQIKSKFQLDVNENKDVFFFFFKFTNLIFFYVPEESLI